MNVFVFKPSNKNIGKFTVDSLDDVPVEFQKFTVENEVSPYDYLECSGETWTVVQSDEGLALEIGRIQPTHERATETTILSTPSHRYKNAYAKAKAIDDVGFTIKTLAIALGMIIVFGGLIISIEEGLSFFVWSLVSGAATAIPFYILGIIISAQGQILKATLDTAVNTSPFLADDEKANAMSLRR